jgi:hypothetical protein
MHILYTYIIYRRYIIHTHTHTHKHTHSHTHTHTHTHMYTHTHTHMRSRLPGKAYWENKASRVLINKRKRRLEEYILALASRELVRYSI